MEVTINWIAVLVATLATMVVGSVWYAPGVFGNAWMKLAGLNKKQLEKNGFKPILVAIVAGFVTSFVLAHFSYLAYIFYAQDYSFLAASLTTAFWAWLGFTAVRIVTHDSFEGRRKKLSLLTVSHELVTFMAIGLIIGLFGV